MSNSKNYGSSIDNGDSFYGRGLWTESNDFDEPYFKTILNTNNIPSISSVRYPIYEKQNKSPYIPRSEWKTNTNYQEESKGIRNEKHEKMSKPRSRNSNFDEDFAAPRSTGFIPAHENNYDISVNTKRIGTLKEQDFEVKGPVMKIVGGDTFYRRNDHINNISPHRAARVTFLDDSNLECEQKGEIKRMIGWDNPFMKGHAGSMDYESRKRYEILLFMDENLLNSSRSSSTNDAYTVEELKNFLRLLNLKVSGTKSELVDRLLFEKRLIKF